MATDSKESETKRDQEANAFYYFIDEKRGDILMLHA